MTTKTPTKTVAGNKKTTGIKSSAAETASEKPEHYWTTRNVYVSKEQQYLLKKIALGWALFSRDDVVTLFVHSSLKAAKAWAEEVVPLLNQKNRGKEQTPVISKSSARNGGCQHSKDWYPSIIISGGKTNAAIVINRNWSQYCLCRSKDRTFCLAVLAENWEVLRTSDIVDKRLAKIWAEQVISDVNQDNLTPL